ncbi:hypothetical membrane protein [Renibacterium salmoninarum ATCC 33209]|uniref:Hypothetical membrane protein n=1 Tax=Renibacterium salmoninarum (strain ATCC 33209 / DSM 20767 / JCM 11484 / NBRC 15589 / NCIMB 2235) TaxID=288705 RepID=A9WLT3_RENSM|nr:hypothetical protein [Renibacterium salmoninarum]ABY21998.1 hypothetical membrane protein [Renibacterium salmoninarum ATCC 33209]
MFSTVLPAFRMTDDFTNLMILALFIFGALMVISALLPKIPVGGRVAGILLGLGFIGYGIYVNLPSTRTVWVGLPLLIVPVVVRVSNISASVKGRKLVVQSVDHGPQGYYPPQQQYPNQAAPQFQGQNQPQNPAPQGYQTPQAQQPPQQYQQPTDPTV